MGANREPIDDESRAAPGTESTPPRVRGLSHGAAAEGERSVKAIGTWADEQPLLAFLIAILR
jgi:hypothetical protein